MSLNEVKICPPTVDVELCDWTISQEKALPTKIVGVVYTKRCPEDNLYDFEPVTLSDDDCLTKIAWVARWEVVDWTPIQFYYDRDGNDITATHKLCPDWNKEQYDLTTPTFFCLNWVDSISRIDITDYSSWTPLVIGSIWQDITWAMIAAPTIGTYTAWACSVSCTPLSSVWTIPSWSSIL